LLTFFFKASKTLIPSEEGEELKMLFSFEQIELTGTMFLRVDLRE